MTEISDPDRASLFEGLRKHRREQAAPLVGCMRESSRSAMADPIFFFRLKKEPYPAGNGNTTAASGVRY